MKTHRHGYFYCFYYKDEASFTNGKMDWKWWKCTDLEVNPLSLRDLVDSQAIAMNADSCTLCFKFEITEENQGSLLLLHCPYQIPSQVSDIIWAPADNKFFPQSFVAGHTQSKFSGFRITCGIFTSQSYENSVTLFQLVWGHDKHVIKIAGERILVSMQLEIWNLE